MSKSKKYEIKTLQDIVDCVTSDNMGYFLKDFSSWLSVAVSLKEISGLTLKSNLTWIDDKKHNATIEFEVKDK